MKTLNIAQEFSTTPGARYENEGPFPGKDQLYFFSTTKLYLLLILLPF